MSMKNAQTTMKTYMEQEHGRQNKYMQLTVEHVNKCRTKKTVYMEMNTEYRDKNMGAQK